MHKDSILNDLISIKNDIAKNDAELEELVSLEEDVENRLDDNLIADDALAVLDKDAKVLRAKIKDLIEDEDER